MPQMPSRSPDAAKEKRHVLISAVRKVAILAAVIVLIAVIVYVMLSSRLRNARDQAFYQTHAAALETMHLILRNAGETRLHAVAESARETAEFFYQKAQKRELSEEAAKQSASAVLSSWRIGRSGRVFPEDPSDFFRQNPRVAMQLAPDVSGSTLESREYQDGFVPDYERREPGEGARSWALYAAWFKKWNWLIAATMPREEIGDFVDWKGIEKRMPFAPGPDAVFSYVLDDRGNLIIHPFWKIPNILDEVDADGKPFVKEMCRLKEEGKVLYRLRENKKELARKTALYTHLADPRWIVATEFDMRRANRPLRLAGMAIFWSAAALLAIVCPLAYWRMRRRVSYVAAVRREAREETIKELRDEAASLRAHTHRLEKDLNDARRTQENLQKTNTQLSAWLDELKKSSHEITLLNKLGDLLQACRTFEETYTVIAQIAGELFPQDAGLFYRFDDSQKTLNAVAAWGDAHALEEDFLLEDCWALRRGKSYIVEHPDSELACQHLASPPPHGYICLPMMAQGELLGLFHLQFGFPETGVPEKARSSLYESKLWLATSVTEQMGLALANLQLREALRIQSIRDPLTGLFNRRYMEESLTRELHRAQRQGSTLGIIMADIDHFKKVNDNYGHEEGDIVLRNTAAIFQKNIRQGDIACRYGGEEFVIIMPDASRDITEQRADMIRERVKRHVSVKQDPVTISMGVAIFPEDGQTIESLANAADLALYQAKERGRDRVVVYSPSES